MKTGPWPGASAGSGAPPDCAHKGAGLQNTLRTQRHDSALVCGHVLPNSGRCVRTRAPAPEGAWMYEQEPRDVDYGSETLAACALAITVCLLVIGSNGRTCRH